MVSLPYRRRHRLIRRQMLQDRKLVKMLTHVRKNPHTFPIQLSSSTLSTSIYPPRGLKRGPPCPLESAPKRRKLGLPEPTIWKTNAMDIEDCAGPATGSSRSTRSVMLAASCSQTLCCRVASGKSVRFVSSERVDETFQDDTMDLDSQPRSVDELVDLCYMSDTQEDWMDIVPRALIMPVTP